MPRRTVLFYLVNPAVIEFCYFLYANRNIKNFAKLNLRYLTWVDSPTDLSPAKVTKTSERFSPKLTHWRVPKW